METANHVKTPPLPRKCAAENCSRQALSSSAWCADCEDEIRALWPKEYDEWFRRVGVMERTK